MAADGRPATDDAVSTLGAAGSSQPDPKGTDRIPRNGLSKSGIIQFPWKQQKPRSTTAVGLNKHNESDLEDFRGWLTFAGSGTDGLFIAG